MITKFLLIAVINSMIVVTFEKSTKSREPSVQSPSSPQSSGQSRVPSNQSAKSSKPSSGQSPKSTKSAIKSSKPPTSPPETSSQSFNVSGKTPKSTESPKQSFESLKLADGQSIKEIHAPKQWNITAQRSSDQLPIYPKKYSEKDNLTRPKSEPLPKPSDQKCIDLKTAMCSYDMNSFVRTINDVFNETYPRPQSNLGSLEVLNHILNSCHTYTKTSEVLKGLSMNARAKISKGSNKTVDGLAKNSNGTADKPADDLEKNEDVPEKKEVVPVKKEFAPKKKDKTKDKSKTKMINNNLDYPLDAGTMDIRTIDQIGGNLVIKLKFNRNSCIALRQMLKFLTLDSFNKLYPKEKVSLLALGFTKAKDGPAVGEWIAFSVKDGEILGNGQEHMAACLKSKEFNDLKHKEKPIIEYFDNLDKYQNSE